MSNVQIIRRSGDQIVDYLDDLARLRVGVFRDWPYLYDGDDDYERHYLAKYAQSSRSVCVLAVLENKVVGASTGIPLADEMSALKSPFIAQAIEVERIFYFGESVLLPAYRGLGIGHRFFDEREAHASSLGVFETTAFCSVQRDAGDPRKPVDYRSNDMFWEKRGYRRNETLTCRLAWKERGDLDESSHELGFWLRRLETAR